MPATPARQFRLTDEAIADLERIAEHIRRTEGRNATKAEAVRYAIRLAVEKIFGKKPK